MVLQAKAILRSREDAEDAVQTALMKVWRRRADFRGDCPISHFLAVCTRNECLQLIRNQSARPLTAPELPQEHALMGRDSGIERSMLARETVAALSHKVSRHRNYGVIFELMLEGYTATEMSEMLDMSANAVKTICFRIRSIAKGVKS